MKNKDDRRQAFSNLMRFVRVRFGLAPFEGSEFDEGEEINVPPEARAVLEEAGYEGEEIESAWQDMNDHPPPYLWRGNYKEWLNWWHFTRDLKDDDVICEGDEYIFDGVILRVISTDYTRYFARRRDEMADE